MEFISKVDANDRHADDKMEWRTSLRGKGPRQRKLARRCLPSECERGRYSVAGGEWPDQRRRIFIEMAEVGSDGRSGSGIQDRRGSKKKKDDQKGSGKGKKESFVLDWYKV